MTLQEVMKQMKACGTEQNRKTWGRYGIQGEMFGVSFADLYKFQKRIKVDKEGHGGCQEDRQSHC